MLIDESSRRSACAAQLRAGARAYAAGAAEHLLARGGEGGGEEATSFALWQAFLAQRVLELGVAVELDEPTLFNSQLAWTETGFRARRMPSGELALALGSLAETLEQELPEFAWVLVRPILNQARDGAPAFEREPDRLGGDDPDHTLALRFLESVLRGETREAVDLVLDAFRRGSSIENLYERVLMPAQAEAGTMWHLGEIGVAEEHAATEIVRTAMSVLWHDAARTPGPGLRVVVGGVSEDRHDIGVRATAHLLELRGCRAVCLGADVPCDEFAQAIVDHEARVAVVSATMTVHLPRAGETIRALRGCTPEVRIIVGGPAFGPAPAVWRKLGADAHAASPREAATLVNASG